jgi:high-affinity iron transporter
MLRWCLPVAALAVIALVGCGGNRVGAAGKDSASKNPPAQPYSKRSTVPDVVRRVTPVDYERPIAAYRRYVRRRLGTLGGQVAALRGAIARDDLGAARAAWMQADATYESIGAAYGAFGDLDAAVNGRPAGLPDGVRSPDFTGLHRVELALWQRRSTRDAVRPAAQLARAVARMRAQVAKLEIDPLEYSLRAHEILEDGIHLQLSGQASPWSGAALVALRAEVRGTGVVLDTLEPLIARRDATDALPQARRALRRLATEIERLERADGSLPRWDRLGQRDRERVDGLAAGAAEHLAYVPELIDPRPARPAQRPFGESG